MTPLPRPSGLASDVRPVVARGGRDLGPWIFAGVALVGALLLFQTLNSRRYEASPPSVQVRALDQAPIVSGLPPLVLPAAEIPPPPPPPPPPDGMSFQPAERPAQVVMQTTPPSLPSPAAVAAPASSAPVPEAPLARSGGSVLVLDRTPGRSGASSIAGGDAADGTAAEAARPETAAARARRLGRLATTVPQGTLIPAVLETALDSTRAGHVRALVTRDVRGFDGTQVLIPRGSRLFGEYEADLSPGQNRAFVRWTRLVRPDGVAIALDSPASDALGRAGVRGRVDSHFLERLGSALLQSTLNIGVAVAGRRIDDSAVIVALPGSAQTLAPTADRKDLSPTLHVDAGLSISVFVARDLSFPSTDQAR